MSQICAQCKDRRERLYWSPGSNKHHFVKHMVKDFKTNLRIPRKFTDEFQGELSETVTLRGPSGNTWTTTFSQRGRVFVLLDGWRNFVEDHSLDEGDLLVFKHVEDSVFEVLIFDDSACEKEASHFVEKHGKFHSDSCCSIHQGKRMKLKKEIMQENEDDDDDDDDDDNHDDDDNEDNETRDSEESEHESSVTKSKTDKPMRLYSMYYESNRRAITEKDKKRAFAKASKFQPKNASCKVTMKPSHVQHLFTLTIPREFADNCLPMTSQTIILRNKSKTWQVKLHRRNVQCTLNKGWAEFVLENTLELDDICVFELAYTGTNKRPTTLDVHIFRAVEKTVPLKVVKPFKN